MRRKILSFFLISFFFSTLFLSPTSIVAQNERIRSFTANITINQDAQILIEEEIVYDFGSNNRHGIFRNLPLVYTNDQGKKFKIKLDVTAVTDENNLPYKYQLSRSSNFLSIKIGDKDRLISGEHTYRIYYLVTGVITYFTDHDEFYWNVTGNDWQVAIDSAQAQVILPDKAEIEQVICYSGAVGSRQQRCLADFSGSQASFATKTGLSSGEGLTIGVSFPKDTVSVVEPQEVGKKTFTEWAILALVAVAAGIYYLVAPLAVFWLWLRYGRDPDVGLPPSAWFDPPKDKNGRQLSPAEVGTLVDEYVDNRDVTATIVDLAIRGFIKIKEEGKDTFRLIKQKSLGKQTQLETFEKQLFLNLFADRSEVTTKALRGKFYQQIEKTKKTIYQTVVKKGFFHQNPQAVRNRFILYAIISFIFGFNLPLFLSLLIFGRAMPRKTLAGSKARQVALGLKNFLGSQERQLTFQVKHWYMFEKLLPYAVVFGVEKIWAKRFADLSVPAPEWYEGKMARSINPVIFTQSLSRSVTSLDSLGVAPSSTSSTGFSSGFSSGGFSGGGFGGGGGGSW